MRGETPVLRVLGTSVTLIEPIKRAAERDLDINLEYITLDGTAAQRRGALEPDSFDIYDQWFHDVDLIWPAGSIQAIDIERIDRWDEINDLAKLGRLSPESPVAAGSDPSKRLYVHLDDSLGDAPSGRISMAPTVHNADSFAIVGSDDPSELTSWASLLDPQWSGRVALQSDAAIGCLDMLLALRAVNGIKVDDLGCLSLEEMDVLTDAVADYRRRGHFRCCWADEAAAIDAMQSDQSMIGSLWWSGFIRLRALGIPAALTTPREGYRGWYGGMALSTLLSGRALDAAYDYMNWWLDGYPGAMMTRNGAYMSNPSTVRAHLSSAEWDFWYAGKPAAEPIRDPYGQVVFQVGERREGGSYEERMSRVAIWDTVMNEHNYLVRRWENALAG
ncbi:MAG: ABC transporter [Hyphomicrobiales bacterium]|nr:ABC transporter [Hyphomicrobiales bacterium]